jgi:hypothetical protein
MQRSADNAYKARSASRVAQLRSELRGSADMDYHHAQVRLIYADVLRIPNDRAVLEHMFVEPEVAQAFNQQRAGPGPDLNYACLTDESPVDRSNRWNMIIFHHIARLLMAEQRKPTWRLVKSKKVNRPRRALEAPFEYWIDLVIEKFKSMYQLHWRPRLPRTVLAQDGNAARIIRLETDEEAALRSHNSDLKRVIYVRRRDRRVKVIGFPVISLCILSNLAPQEHERRLNVTSAKAHSTRGREQRQWNDYHQSVADLGPDGMSSDESAYDTDGGVVYEVCAMPWRRNLDGMMDHIDATRLEPGSAYGAMGPNPRRRRRSSRKQVLDHPDTVKVSKRTVPIGLPLAYYDPDFIAREGGIENVCDLLSISEDVDANYAYVDRAVNDFADE